MKTIQLYLFAGCKSLKTLQYNSNCAPSSIENYAFWECKSLTETDIVYPESVNTIGEGAFQYCTSLEGYTIPNHITAVGNYAFRGCEKLKSIVIKPSVQSIGNYAFNGCTSLTGVTIEESEETLSLGYNSYNSNGTGKGMFYDCPLQSVFIGRPLNYSYYDYYSNYTHYYYNDYPNRFGYSPFANNETLTKVYFGNTVTRIPNYLFQGNTKLDNVEFAESCQLQSVGKYAFDGCKILPTLQFPNTVTVFEECAFRNCAAFTDFELPKNLVTIGSYTFQNCSGLTELTIPATTTSIGNYAYTGCTGIKSIVMADGEDNIWLGYGASKGKGYGLFNDCPLEKLYLGRTVSYDVNSNGNYGYSPFYNQQALTSVTVSPKVRELPYCIFFGCAAEEIYIPSSVRTIHSSSLNDCQNLKKVIILGATPPSLDNYNTFLSGSAEASKIYVFFPDQYKSTKVWKDYADKIDVCCEIYSNLTYSGEGHVIGYKSDFPIVLENRETETADAGTYNKRLAVIYTTNDYSLTDVLDFEYTIQKAPLTITVKSCSRSYGEENPEFQFDFEGFVNDEDEKVLTKEPIASTNATAESNVGEYEITVSGAETKNYEITYVNGTLTITQAQQEILWETPKEQCVIGESVELTATSTSGMEVIYSTDDEDAIQIKKKSGKVYATCLKTGTYHVTASQEGNANYQAAEPVTWTVKVEKSMAVEDFVDAYLSKEQPTEQTDVDNDGEFTIADVTSYIDLVNGVKQDDIVIERKYLVNSRGDYRTSWEGKTSDNYAFQEFVISFDNGRSLVVGYYNTYYWDDSRNKTKQGVFLFLGGDGINTKELYLEPRRNDTWINERIVVKKDGTVKYYANNILLGEETFEELNFESAKNITIVVSPSGWWYTHYHYMDDLKVSTPCTIVTDDFNDGEIDPQIWNMPMNSTGVREEDGIMKTEQLKTDVDYRLISKPIPLSW